MIRRFFLLFIALIWMKPAFSEGWFQSNTSLTQAHQHLLEDDLSGMFNTLIELWQSEPSSAIKPHLNQLLGLSLDKDCGKSLTQDTLPDWISGINIVRQRIQSPGRNSYRLMVKLHTTKLIQNIALKRWADGSISSDSSLTVTKQTKEQSIGVAHEKLYIKRYNLTGKLDAGLYHLSITSRDNQNFQSWVILNNTESRQYVHWTSKENWKVEKKALNNPYCPLPELNVSLFNYVDGQYKQVWSENYETNYPHALALNNIASNRYFLVVSLKTRRWQGDVIVEQEQTINRTYDLTHDD